MKKYPDILELVDDIYSNPIFETKDIIISKKAIASKTHLTSVVPRENVLMIWDCNKKNENYHGKYRVVQTLFKQNLVFRTSKRKIHMLVSHEKITKKVLKEYCPNAEIEKL